MAPTLYHVPKTISSPIIQILLELGVKDNGINVETLTFKDLKTPAHLARNPMGTSPTFTDDDISIWESGAILTYLLETYDTQHRFHPKHGTSTPSERAKFLHLQQYITATVYPFLASLYLHTLKPINEQDPDYVSSAKEKWRTLLAPTLVSFLKGQSYFMGNSVSAIDFLVAKPLNNAEALNLLQDFPELSAILTRIRCMPSFAVAYDIDADKIDCPAECRSFLLLPN